MPHMVNDQTRLIQKPEEVLHTQTGADLVVDSDPS